MDGSKNTKTARKFGVLFAPNRVAKDRTLGAYGLIDPKKQFKNGAYGYLQNQTVFPAFFADEMMNNSAKPKTEEANRYGRKKQTTTQA
jgi:hypothetical protein